MVIELVDSEKFPVFQAPGIRRVRLTGEARREGERSHQSNSRWTFTVAVVTDDPSRPDDPPRFLVHKETQRTGFKPHELSHLEQLWWLEEILTTKPREECESLFDNEGDLHVFMEWLLRQKDLYERAERVRVAEESARDRAYVNAYFARHPERMPS